MNFAHTYLRLPRSLFKRTFQGIERVLRTEKVIEIDVIKKESLEKSLVLFHYTTCVFCLRVRLELARLRLNIEKKEIDEDVNAEKELLDHGGKIQVPCLKIRESNGSQIYLYESSAIIDYLRSMLTS